jgi:glyoxylate reductase
MKPFVYITRKIPSEIVENLQSNFEVEMWEREDAPVPRTILLEKSKKASALFTVLSDNVDHELFEVSSELKVVANMAVGFDNIDLDAANEKGVAICNTPDVLTETTADLTFALLMATARRVVEAAQFVREGEWKSWSPLLLAGTDIHHKTIGIVGMGSIGEAVAKRAKGFDMDILYHNRSRKQKAEEELDAVYTELDELLKRADFIVCLAPLTAETKGLFQKEQFRMMKKSAIFINAARGPIVNEEDLYEALKNKEIAGAGLDVFDKEPIKADHSLLTLKNVVALPHIGSSSRETRYGMMMLCVENINLILNGDKPKTLVNKEWLGKEK